MGEKSAGFGKEVKVIQKYYNRNARCCVKQLESKLQAAKLKVLRRPVHLDSVSSGAQGVRSNLVSFAVLYFICRR